jgi:opacity protein-like surface antigen
MRAELSIFALALTMVGTGALAQGLQAVRARGDSLGDPKPMTYSTGIHAGYDSLNYKVGEANDFDSMFIQGGAGASWSDADQTTPWALGVDGGVVHYLDDMGPQDQNNYSARATFDVSHTFSDRLSMMNNFYVTYEVEPNFGQGASTALRNGQYFYGYNNFAMSYAWSERFSTTTSYTVDAIKYEDELIAKLEDRMSHILSQQASWAWSKTLKVVGEYRYRMVNYERGTSNFNSHYLLAGMDKAWSERSTGTFRAGAELYSSDRTEKTAPYFEASLNHATSDKTSITAFTGLGFDGSELGNYGSRYSARLGTQVNHRITKRFGVNGGMNYAHSTFEGTSGVPDVTEHQLSAVAGVAYELWDNINVDANYSYSVVMSDDTTREYDRNRVTLGVSAAF